MTSSLSYVVGPTDPPLIEQTIGQALDTAVARWGAREALVSIHQDVRLTWAEFADAVDAFAAGLLELGLDPGDRVAVWAPNCAEWTIAQFATARAGLIQVNINPAYRTSELEFTLRKVGAKAMICAESFKTSHYVEMVEALLREAEDPLALRHLIKIGGDPRRGWLQFHDVGADTNDGGRSRLASVAAELSNTDAINIQFTSGTTGSPKGATLSHRNVLNNAYFVGRGMGLVQGDRLCIPVPLYHCFGMVMGNLACLMHGATMVYPSAAFDPGAVLRAVELERCTALHGVPTMFIAELEHPEFYRFDLSSLRTGLMAGAPCPIEVMKKVIGRMHMRDVGIAYGMTETSPVSFQTTVDDSLARRVSTIGRVQPHLEVKIVDPATGETAPMGEPGELYTRGYSTMLGYWDDPDKTAEALRDGWMQTGDLAVLDEDGYGSIVGRLKDMIIRGGENIYPRELEDFLFQHPEISEAYVLGVPDHKYGEEVCAWVKRRDRSDLTEEQIIDYCRDRIARHKIPRYLRFVDDFPMTVTGKVQKFAMRQTMIDDLGLDLDGSS